VQTDLSKVGGPARGISVFDDGASPAMEAQSRAILLDLDTSAMKATLKRSCSPASPRPGRPGNSRHIA
jgi:hypothetical protein